MAGCDGGDLEQSGSGPREDAARLDRTVRRLTRLSVMVAAVWIGGVAQAEAQLGALLSPGRLSKAHANLEGIKSCTQCHEQGNKVTAAKCLACHKPVAERIARKMGVHKNVKAECVSCHAEHAGVDGELRPFDTARFDHSGVTGFALDGKHAPLAQQCAACHKTRSFLTLAPACTSCHKDIHNGTLGATCTSCHSTKTAFKEMSGLFDHSKARFALVGAHQKVACEQCHANKVFRGLKFGACVDCHKDPHERGFGAACTTCHVNDTWRTRKVDHSRTAFALVGKHTTVACALCHKQPPMSVKLKADTCATCHVDVHKGAFKQDCKSCHNESGFGNSPFDHSTTKFPLQDKHEKVDCNACHKSVVTAGLPVAKRVADFRGLKTACVSCHADVHQGELAQACETCHSPKTFQVTTFTHPRLPEFYEGQHAPVACAGCHKAMSAVSGPAASAPPSRAAVGPQAAVTTRIVTGFKNTATTCVSCHKDEHLGQVGKECQTCHSIEVAKFGVVGFSHDKTSFKLTGKHQPVECVKCHKKETGAFPSEPGTAVRFKGVAKECRGCHTDVHIGQFQSGCDTCHSPETFKIASYKHLNRSLASFFVGRHLKASCAACHKPVTGVFPGGTGTATSFRIDAKCVSCHTDVHRGSLGSNCIECHRP